MARVKRGTRKTHRRKKYLKLAKGYFSSRHRLYRSAKEQVEKSLQYAYRDRRNRKREFRRLWIVRINAGCRQNGIGYAEFMGKLAKAQIALNRKVLADMAVHQPEHFAQLVKQVQSL